MSPAHNSLEAEILGLEQAYLDTLSVGSFESLVQPCENIFARAYDSLSQGVVSPRTMRHLVRVAARIGTVSSALVSIETKQAAIVECFRVQAAECLERASFPLASPPAPMGDDSASFAPYRRWFLDNFSNPYPSAFEKTTLLALVPSHNKQQLDTWFTNTRRRSGWQDLKRQHTNGTPEHLAKLLADVDDPAKSEAVDEAVAKKVKAVRAFFAEGGRDRVGEAIQALVKQGAPRSATKRRIEQKAPRGLGGRDHPRRRAATPPLQGMGGSAFSFETLSSPESIQPYPRYPSTFSTPSSSRTVSASSTSSFTSFDSVLSYSTSISASSYGAPMLPPSSPPASSSLLSWNGHFVAPSTDLPFPPQPRSRPHQPQSRPLSMHNPYFFTLNDAALLPATPTSSSFSSLAAFAATAGDLLVDGQQ
ncbi:hypothetical protein JCM1841_005764 [Sporobolomyces salmonicolor]